MRIKICGATSREEIVMLEQEGVAYVGLWTGIDGHRYNLSNAQFRDMAAACRSITPVAVCVRKPIDALLALLEDAPVNHVQLHGFNMPRDVALLKARRYSVIKTLHVTDDGTSPEARWIDKYADAGCDIFLIDRYGGPDQVGSSGQPLSENIAREWQKHLSGHRVWLAGGLTPDRVARLSEECAIETADVDTAARHLGFIARQPTRLLVTAALPVEAFQEIA